LCVGGGEVKREGGGRSERRTRGRRIIRDEKRTWGVKRRGWAGGGRERVAAVGELGG